MEQRHSQMWVQAEAPIQNTGIDSMWASHDDNCDLAFPSSPTVSAGLHPPRAGGPCSAPIPEACQSSGDAVGIDQHGEFASPSLEAKERTRIDTTVRDRLSDLLARNGVATGVYACGGTLETEEWPCLPRIKQKTMYACLTLPLGQRESEKLKAAQIKAGQGLDLNEDGLPETRLPWAIRPEADFKIVNHRAWTIKVVTPIVRKVQEALGCEEWNVEASLSEMLLCEEGCFYSEGKESDESPGVFATLMIQLPSKVQGGVFTVSDPSTGTPANNDGVEGDMGEYANHGSTGIGNSMTFSGPSMYYAAFYTDCERELSQVTSGCLLALVYNLCRVEPVRKVPEKVGRGVPGAGWDPSTDLSMTKRETQDWEREGLAFFGAAGGGAAAASGAQPGILGKDNQSLWAKDALRRRRAVFADFADVPQPADAQLVRDIVEAVRRWSVATDAPPKLVIALSHRYADHPMGYKELKGRDRAVCNLMRLAREVAARDALAAKKECHGDGERQTTEQDHTSSSDDVLAGGGAQLEVFLTRLVVTHGETSKGAYTSGPFIPLEPGNEPCQVRCAGRPHDTFAFRPPLRPPPDDLPVDICSQVLHSGGDDALRDLEDGVDKIFAKGPEAVEFLGNRVAESSRFEPAPVENGGDGGGSSPASTPVRFFVRWAIAFWPRSKRNLVQMEPRSSVHGILARLRQQLSALDEARPSAAATVAWPRSEDCLAMIAAVLALVGQPHELIEDERDIDVVFECLHRTEDAQAACKVIDALCSALMRQKSSISSTKRSARCACMTGGREGAVRRAQGIANANQQPSSTSRILSVTGLYSRVFSLMDGLNAWRTSVPQLRRLVALNPSAFAGAVVARAAIWESEDGINWHGHRTNAPQSLAQATEVPPTIVAVRAGVSTPTSASKVMSRRRPSWLSSLMQGGGGQEMAINFDAESKGRSKATIDCGGGGGDRRGASDGARENGNSPGDAHADSTHGSLSGANTWRCVLGEILAETMTDVARGKVRGAERCCTVADVRSSACPASAAVSFDAAFSPLPLMTRALEDVVGNMCAARMMRESFGWIVRGEGDFAESDSMSLEAREQRLDQLGSLLWHLGDLRRSLPRRDKAAGDQAAAESEGEGDRDTSGKLAQTLGVPCLSVAAEGERVSSTKSASCVRLVCEELQVQLVRLLDAAASRPLPDDTFPSFQMDEGFTCEHRIRIPGGGDDDEGCVTCEEVVRPFLANPYECCTSWVPWAGTTGDDFPPEFFQRLGLRFEVEGTDIKAIFLTKPNGSAELQNAMAPARNALYLRDRAMDILTSANTLAWLLYDEEKNGKGSRGGDFDTGGAGRSDSGGSGGGRGSGGGSGGNANGAFGDNADDGVVAAHDDAALGGSSNAPRGGVGSGELDFAHDNEDLELTSIYHVDGADLGSVCSEDWASLVDGHSHERRDSSSRDVLKASDTVAASAATATATETTAVATASVAATCTTSTTIAVPSKENNTPAGANHGRSAPGGGGDAHRGRSTTWRTAGGGDETQSAAGDTSASTQERGCGGISGSGDSGRRWTDRIDPAAVEKRIWDERQVGTGIKCPAASSSTDDGAAVGDERHTDVVDVRQTAIKGRRHREEAESDRSDRSDPKQDAASPKSSRARIGVDESNRNCTGENSDTTRSQDVTPAQAAAAAVAEAVAAGMSAVNLEAAGGLGASFTPFGV